MQRRPSKQKSLKDRLASFAHEACEKASDPDEIERRLKKINAMLNTLAKAGPAYREGGA